jgi:hypothetical protein
VTCNQTPTTSAARTTAADPRTPLRSQTHRTLMATVCLSLHGNPAVARDEGALQRPRPSLLRRSDGPQDAGTAKDGPPPNRLSGTVGDASMLCFRRVSVVPGVENGQAVSWPTEKGRTASPTPTLSAGTPEPSQARGPWRPCLPRPGNAKTHPSRPPGGPPSPLVRADIGMYEIQLET